jgi:succinyl-CoA synthetase beta subunit
MQQQQTRDDFQYTCLSCGAAFSAYKKMVEHQENVHGKSSANLTKTVVVQQQQGGAGRQGGGGVKNVSRHHDAASAAAAALSNSTGIQVGVTWNSLFLCKNTLERILRSSYVYF